MQVKGQDFKHFSNTVGSFRSTFVVRMVQKGEGMGVHGRCALLNYTP